jgi:hypothetical protein
VATENGDRPSRFKTAVHAAFGAGAAIVLTVAVVGFLIGSVLWFIASAKGDGTIEIGNAFAGLGYMGATLVVLLLAVLGWRLLGLLRAPQPRERRRGARKGGDDRAIITNQLAWGSALILAGAILGIVCLCFIDPGDEALGGPVLALATAVIGAGATLLPAGAAGTAGARLRDAAAARPAPLAVTGSADRTGDDTATVSGTVDPRGNDVNAFFEYQDEPPGTPEAPIARSQQTVHISAAAQEQSVKVDVTGLRKDQAYRVRLVAEVPSGARSEGKWVGLGPEPEKGDSPEPP